jgi:8-oxo-dGTP pyrophosphatase MutT (NUDIX family)
MGDKGMTENPEYVRQAAAVPLRRGKVCLITRSNSKRWVIPKGMIDPGKTAGEAALQEAWEEAGLVGALEPEPIGSYLYEKLGRTHHVTVFVMRVTEAAMDWPESGLRRRVWVTPAAALDQIDDPGLAEVLRLVYASQADMTLPV